MMETEKRLIDMDDTINKLRDYAERKHEAGHTELANGILKAMNYIHNGIVRADAVEVVRCRDCFADGCCSVQIDLDMGGDGYCSKGKQKNKKRIRKHYSPEPIIHDKIVP